MRRGSDVHRRGVGSARRIWRSDIWSVAGDEDQAGKPHPVVIVQDDSFNAIGPITVCAFTTDPTDAPLFRLPVEPNDRNMSRAICRLEI